MKILNLGQHEKLDDWRILIKKWCNLCISYVSNIFLVIYKETNLFNLSRYLIPIQFNIVLCIKIISDLLFLI